LLCEKQHLIFEHQEWAGQKVDDPDHWYECWDVVRSVGDTGVYNTLRLTFSRLEGSNTTGVLTFNDYQATSSSVLFTIEAGCLTKKCVGRLTYVAPEFMRDFPLPRKQ
jgi:hypothetical protein